MRSHFGLEVKPIEPVECYDLTKGKRQTLHLAVVREGETGPTADATALSTGDGTTSKQTLVK